MTTDVVIAGGGPNGLMLACELRLAGARPVVLETLREPSEVPKANGLLGQVVRMADHRGLYEALSGNPGPPEPNSAYFMFAAMPLDLSLLQESPVYGLPVPQRRIVQVLEERALELGVEIRRGHRLTGVTQDDDAVTVEVEVAPSGSGSGSAEVPVDGGGEDTGEGDGGAGGYRLRARYLVGADGAHSATRKLAGIGFPGVSYDRRTTRAAHATVPEEWQDPANGALVIPGHGPVLPFLPHRSERGGFAYAPFPGLPPLISTTEWDQPEPEEPMSLDELRASARRVLGADLPLGPPPGEGPHVLRRQPGGNTRVAERFRDRRVFLVGDAAHVYADGGGPGLNLGLQDAVNLGWKLAARLRGDAPSGLLDSYEAERAPAARRMVVNAQAQTALTAPGSDVTALRELFTELLGHRDTVQHLAELLAGADVRYEMGVPEAEAHPGVGRFAPDLEVIADTGPVRLAELARTARPLLVDLTEDATAAEALADRSDRLTLVTAKPQSGSPATALLLRPDGYVAWASDAPRPTPAELDTLRAAADRWFTP